MIIITRKDQIDDDTNTANAKEEDTKRYSVIGFEAVLHILRHHPKLVPLDFKHAHRQKARLLKSISNKTKPKPNAAKPPACCPNCETTQTSYWRRCSLTGTIMCNACSLYAKAHGVMRPIDFWNVSSSNQAERDALRTAVSKSPLQSGRRTLKSTYTNGIQGKYLAPQFEDDFWNHSLWKDDDFEVKDAKKVHEDDIIGLISFL